MIDIDDELVIEFLRGAGWHKIGEGDVVIEREILDKLIFDAQVNAYLTKKTPDE